MIGKTLGHYQITRQLGKGGMGEVYQAKDEKLGRDVAIKVLPEEFAKDTDRVARFQREATLLASLNHPNIAAIYGLEEFDGTNFLVLELVEGKTLADRIKAGPIPVEESLKLALQIAEALEAAHEKGVIHRDLKPANVMVTPAHKIKILDFGLAKQSQPASDSEQPSQTLTAVTGETMPGTILGTAGYMSPEQARGKAGDERSDIWAFGCILFEMLSGKKTFAGDTASDKIASILAREPNWDVLPGEIPQSVKHLLQQCLEKDLDRRFPKISDARAAVDPVLITGQVGEGFPRRFRFGLRSVFVIATIFLLLAAATAWIGLTRRSNALSAIPDRKFLVVPPFKDLSGQASGQLIGDGMVATLSARLARRADIQVVMPSVVIPASEKDADPFRLAQSFGANLLMQGTLQRNGDSVRITFSVWNVQQRVQIAGDTLDGAASDIFGIEDRLAEDFIASLKLPGALATQLQATGLDTAAEQEQYIKAIGNLQRYDKDSAVNEAIQILTALAGERPSAPLVQAALGRAYLNKFLLTRDSKWVEYASDACTRSQQLSPDLPEVDVTVGELRSASGRAKDAIASFQRALSAQPNNFPALLGLADALEITGNLHEAEATYKRTIDLQPSYWGGHSKLAGFYYRHAQYAQAADTFRRVTELSPDNSRAFGNLGAAYEAMGDFERALAEFRKSLSLAPTAMAYSGVGTVEFFSGHPRAAVDAYEAAVRLSPNHFLFWVNLGDAYRWTPELKSKAADAYAKAISLCRSELRQNAEQGRVRSVLAISLAKTGKIAEAEEQAQKALSMDPDNPEFLYNAALVADIAHKNREALAWILLASKKGYSKAFIAREPEFGNLRSDPVFKEAVQSQQ